MVRIQLNDGSGLIVLLSLCLLSFFSVGCAKGPKQTAPLNSLETPVSYPSPEAFSGVPECEVKSIRYLGLGGELAWAPSGDLIAFQRRDGSGIYQLHTIRPDGSDEKCITCGKVPGGPSLDRHKGFPAWHPSEEYIVTQVEMEKYISLKKLTEPGRGGWNNLWVVTPDGKQWSQLTDYPSNAPTGVLNPRFSHGGSKLFWAERIARASRGAPFGRWQLVVADFVLDAGEPQLENVKTYRPGNGVFFEAHGFSPDDSKLLFTADIGAPGTFVFNIFTFDLVTQELWNLTNLDDEWNEHATYSPHGRKISFVSSRCCPGYDPAKFSIFNLDVLRTETYIMNPAGSEVMQITHFNTPGFPEFQSEPGVAIVSSWSPDGSQIAIAQFLVGKSYDTVEARRMWIVTFQGQCG